MIVATGMIRRDMARKVKPGARTSVGGLRPLSQELFLALLGRGEQLLKLWRAPERREHGVVSKAVVGAIASCADRALEKVQSDLPMSTSGEILSQDIAGFRVWIGHYPGFPLPNEIGCIGG
jgi:hypothetical protein